MTNKKILLILFSLLIAILSDSFLAHLPFLDKISWILIWIFFVTLTGSIVDSFLAVIITGFILELNRMSPQGGVLASLGFFWLCTAFGLKYFFSQMTLLGASLLFLVGGLVYYAVYYLYLKIFSAIFATGLIIEINRWTIYEKIIELLLSLLAMVIFYLFLSKLFQLFNFSRINHKF